MLYSILLVFVLLIPHTTTFWCGECGTYASGYTCFLSSRGAGWYREWSQSLCVQCTNSLCPGDKDGTSIPWNTCPPAQYITRYPDTTQYNTLCSPCPANKYCPGSWVSSWSDSFQAYSCSTCSRSVIKACTTSTDSVCLPFGYYWNGTDLKECSQCLPGAYMIKDCIQQDTQCSICPKNAYCPGNTDLNVTYSCPLNSYSLSGAKNVTDCISKCNIGTFMFDRTCQLCETGYFCNNATKFECPANSTSKQNASSYADCYCKAGFTGNVYSPDRTSCTPCPIGSFCPSVITATSCQC